MAKFVRVGAVKWTVFAAGFSALGAACGPQVVLTSGSGGTLNGPAGGSGTGGSLTASGGKTNAGGASAAGGTAPGGGTSASGGTANGGSAPAAGGADAAGGGGPTGGGSPAGGSVGVGGGSSGGGLDNYNPDFVEDSGADCTLPEPKTLAAADHHLPDPFLMPDGMRMSTKDQWKCQRAWLKKTVEAFVHGKKPPKPATVTGTVSASSISIHVEEGGKTADFSYSIASMPSGAGPVPAVFQADGSGVPASFLKGEGVAAINYSHSTSETAFNKIYSGASVSPQIKWAWGVSRAIDVLVSEKEAGKNSIIDPTALGTTGCSYAGKSAFTVGAFDERIAVGMPMESGTGGLASYRVVGDNDKGPNNGEGPETLNEACAKWFGPTFCGALSKVDSNPADAHFMVAMYAPRGFTIFDNNRIGHLSPVASYAADAVGAEVFKALGIPNNVGYHGGNDTDPHGHCSWNKSQEDTAKKAIAGFLTKKSPPANFMEPKLKNASDQPVDFMLSKYITWTAPTLQ